MNRRCTSLSRKPLRTSFLPLLIAAVIGAGGAFAQVHQVDLSNPLDANPGVGTGGANQGVQGYVPINGNDVMTGNVAGLKSFHGQVGRPGNQTGLGTFSQYEFNAPQGSAALQDFGRLTAGGGVNGAVNQAYFLPSTTVSTAYGTLYSSPINGGFDSALVPSSVVSPSAVTRTDLLTQNQQQYGSAYGGVDRSAPAVVNPGEPGAVLQSPIFWERTKAALLEQQEANQAYQGATMVLGAATMPGVPATAPAGGVETQPADQVQETIDQGMHVQISGVPNEVKNATAGHKGVDASVSHSSALLLAALDKASGEQDTDNGSDQGNASPAQGGLGNDNRTERGIDPLTGNERDMRHIKPRTASSGNGGAGQLAGTGDNDLGSTGTGDTGTGAMGTGMGGRGSGDTGTGMAGPGTGGTAGAPGMAGGMMGSGAAGRGTSAMGPGLSAKRLADAPDSELRAGSKVKPVKLAEDNVLQGTGATRFDVMMAQGGLDLRQGKYLDASQAFQAAMASKPEDPLAVVGRAHAEMGAGMYAAAAFDLKFVFTRKPELMSVKYDVGSFIPAGRQAFLLQDLKKLTADKDAGDMAAFLYSYLCYQTGRTDLLQGELGSWGAQSGHDQWQSVATRAWGAAAGSK